MCDYSLEMYESRTAQESEIYVTTRFPSGSIGFTAPSDCSTAICVSYGTKMTLENLPLHLQQELGVSSIESVVFARVEGNFHHDGVRFENGQTVLLQKLGVGVFGNLVGEEKKIAEHAPVKQTLVEPAE